ncbi:SDR family oxidoreductase [Agrobacterium pusense]|uniref:SDR family oxidoreductase n=1 Tax=Agrobacterium pusense TaxID=648995 RepID=UPI003FD2110D
MTQTVLITGTSSGFGKAAVHRFASEGWNVLATMRDTTKCSDIATLQNVEVLPLDVAEPSTIASAIEAGIARFGRIDAVVNNAGYGLFGIFEGVVREAIADQFAVNVFGVMDVTRAILPHFRANRAGTIINISSGAGAIGFPMASLYSASKFALEGFSEGLSYELGALGIKVKVIEPGGATQTGFMTRMGGESASQRPIEDYLPFLEDIGKVYGGFAESADPDAVEKVVSAIYEAANDTSDRLRFAPTADIQPLLDARRGASEEGYRDLTRSIFSPEV